MSEDEWPCPDQTKIEELEAEVARLKRLCTEQLKKKQSAMRRVRKAESEVARLQKRIDELENPKPKTARNLFY